MKYYLLILLKLRVCAFYIIGAFLFSSIFLAGCGDNVTSSSVQQLSEFERAGSIEKAKMPAGPYRVVPDDVLEISMPAILQIVTAEEPKANERIVPYVCRVNQDGTITLPLIGEIPAASKTLSEIESAIIAAYYPHYAKTRPSVFCRVLEYKTANAFFSVIGLVEKPGNFPYPPGMQYSLMQALGLAGGIDKVAEPRYATVYRLMADGSIASAVFQIADANPTEIGKAMNICLKPGDIVDVASTPRTRTNVFLRTRFGLNFGAFVPLSD